MGTEKLMMPDTTTDLDRLGQALVHALPDAVIFSDRNGIIRHWNAGAARIFGYTPGEALGQRLDIIIPERLRARHWEGYDHMMATGHRAHDPSEVLSVPAIDKHGAALSIQFTVAAVTRGDGSIDGIVAVLRDVTESFRELRQLRRDAAKG